MNNLEKHFVNYQQAMYLKSIGFDEPCFAYFDTCYQFKSPSFLITYQILKNDGLLAPLKSQVFEWFRKEHNIQITPCAVVQGTTKWYNLSIVKIVDEKYDVLHDYVKFSTYEKAESACIDKLMELVKKK